MSISNLKPAYTPQKLANANHGLNIPIYQRLFVWEEEQIKLLLEDLYNAYQHDKDLPYDLPYYIGIITIVKKNSRWDVVDGQQRLTFLSLFAAYCCSLDKDSSWKKFLYQDSELRINYEGRPEDREDLKIIIEQKNGDIKNSNFRMFVNCITTFKEKINENTWSDFSEYVYSRASFLVSELPENYKTTDLNLFFEKMNSTGRQLTVVEQIKGKYFPGKADLFDACLNFETKFEEPNNECNSGTEGENNSLLEILKNEQNRDINPEPPLTQKEESARSILSPEVFLLHCLKLHANETEKDSRNLLTLFNKSKFDDSKLLKFWEIMKTYRKWLDDNIIYLKAMNEGAWDYNFRGDDEESQEMDKLKQFQAMLYVSSSPYQEWVLTAYRKSQGKDVSLDLLKEIDHEQHPSDSLNENVLKYGCVDRYWFWKLDYLLWERFTDENACSFFKEYDLSGSEKEAIRTYRFRPNRSIEHLHPQTDAGAWEEEQKHRFGNLAMISSSFNSAQSNDSIGIKFARLTDVQLKIPGRLESIKLLLMFKSAKESVDGWTSDAVEDHENKMFELLEVKLETSILGS